MSGYAIYPENFLIDLLALASKEFQLVGWFENDQGIASSFSSEISDLFDDGDVKKALYEEGVVVISHEADKALRELSDAIDNVDVAKVERGNIDLPEMESVRQKATKAFKLVKASDGSESTIEFLKTGTPDVLISIEDALEEVKKSLVAKPLVKDKYLLYST
ncbi:MAG: hypothetical protein MK052_04215 [Alphaproteobacteria bacterium]|nr:hypothetical protein [Alphaproteobacteria bacterium]